jgi:ferredoxin/coenzyme F420-reducing hydrogenase delta subunit
VAVGLDWFYLPAYPLTDMVPGLLLWGAFALLTVVLVWMPWLPPRRRTGTATVELSQCNGCGRCVADCPFNAVALAPRSDGKPFAQEAVVDPSLCTSCGICVGACPPSTPFRRSATLVTGIDLPDRSLADLRARTLDAAAGLSGEARVIVYACNHGPDLKAVTGPSVAAVTMPCVAMLPPSFIDFVITRGHADGVMLTGCRQGDCHHRQGIDWTRQRIEGTRDPYLRQRVPRKRLATCWAGLVPADGLARDLMAFRARLKELGPYRPEPARPPAQPDLEAVPADD